MLNAFFWIVHKLHYSSISINFDVSELAVLCGGHWVTPREISFWGKEKTSCDWNKRSPYDNVVKLLIKTHWGFSHKGTHFLVLKDTKTRQGRGFCCVPSLNRLPAGLGRHQLLALGRTCADIRVVKTPLTALKISFSGCWWVPPFLVAMTIVTFLNREVTLLSDTSDSPWGGCFSKGSVQIHPLPSQNYSRVRAEFSLCRRSSYLMTERQPL